MNQLRTVRLLLAAAFVVPVVGCAPAQLSPEVARGMVQLRHDLATTKAQLQSTSASLADIEKNPRNNTAQQIGFFQEEMAKLEAANKQVRDVSTQLETDSDAYFAKWQKDAGKMQDPQLAEAAKQRKEASEKAVQTVRAKLQELKRVAAPFMASFRDMNRYFDNDKTAEGAQAALPAMQRALSRKDAAIAKIDECIKVIDEMTKSVE